MNLQQELIDDLVKTFPELEKLMTVVSQFEGEHPVIKVCETIFQLFARLREAGHIG